MSGKGTDPNFDIEEWLKNHPRLIALLWAAVAATSTVGVAAAGTGTAVAGP
jgi:hypothetical protein